MIISATKRFQILALSGGGFRGLYTAKFLAGIEEEIESPIAKKFDLIAGTSIGGIIALAIAMEIPMKEIVSLFESHGGDIFKKRLTLLGFIRSSYSSLPLKKLLSDDKLFGNRLLGDCLHPVIVPSINYSSGQPVLFKTPHHVDFKRDHKHNLIDISLATSAAPAYFPRHSFNNCQYVDGGLYANAPGLLAVHEAKKFFNINEDKIHVFSVGTMSSKFTVDPHKDPNGGLYDWGGIMPSNTPKRIFGLSISVHESLSNFMLEHILNDKYFHVDDDLTDDQAKAVALDKTDKYAREVLLGRASERSKSCISNNQCKGFLDHTPSTPIFYYGNNANVEEN